MHAAHKRLEDASKVEIEECQLNQKLLDQENSGPCVYKRTFQLKVIIQTTMLMKQAFGLEKTFCFKELKLGTL